MAYEQITFDTADGVAVITFNRPDKLNTMTQVMEEETADAVATAGADPSVRAIILTGAGRGFCAGVDLSGTPGAPPRPRPGPDRFEFLWDADKPLIAAINGPAAGVGLSIALHCDLRYLAEGAVVTTSFARRGLIAEHGSAWLLPRAVGAQNAADLLLSGRKVEAAEAASMGLGWVRPAEGFLDRVRAEARERFSECSPRSLRIIKSQLRASDAQDYAAAQVLAHREQLESLNSADAREGIAAFREKRAANFTGE